MNAQVRYTIVAGDPNRDFSIGEDSGVLRLAKSLNYERKRSYSLTVQAEDSGEQVRYDTATISISVTDCNDNPPVFLDSPYLAFVRENMVEIPATVLRVNAYDADTATNNHQVRYLMKDGDKGSFRVNTSTGEITVHRALDREQQSEFLLTVVAMDTGTTLHIRGASPGYGKTQFVVDDDGLFECDGHQ
jgi:protocadherin Fat 4